MDASKKPSFAARFMCIAACAAAVFAAAADIVVMLRYYDSAVNLYAASPIPTALNITIGAVTVVLLLSGLFVKRGALGDKLSQMSQFSVFASGLCGFLCAATALMRVYEYFTGAFTVAAGNTSAIFACIAAVFAIPACIYFIAGAVKSSFAQKPKIITGFFVIIWGAFTLVSAYFDMTTPLNCPPRIINQVACIAIMIYMLYELRFPLDAARPRHFVSFGCAALFILAVNGISVTALTFLGIFAVGYQTVFAIFQVAMALYILSRLLTLTGKPHAENADANLDEVKKKALNTTEENA